jgi:GAF domain-containing protein/HAMP domain-containing protein
MEHRLSDSPTTRGRSRWFRPGDWPILVKILLGMVALVMLALGVATGVNAFTLYTDLRQQIGAQFENLAAAEVNHLGDILSKQLTILTNITLIHEVQDRATAANARYSGDQAAIEAELLDIDQQWLAAADDSELVLSVIDAQSNQVTRQLRDFMASFPDHVEIFVTDRYGGLLAATGRTSDYYQADEGWWQAAFNSGQGGYYISQPGYDESSGYTALDMAIPIVSESGQVIGVARTTYRIEAVYQAVSALQFGETGHVTVIDSTGRVIADPNPAHVGELMPPSWVDPGIAEAPSGWRELVNAENEPVLAGHATLAIAAPDRQAEREALRSLGWILFVNQAQSEAYAPVVGAVRRGILAAGVFILIAAGLALLLARALVSPVTNLVAVARGMASGDLSVRARSRRHDEIGELAEAFDTMADEIAGMFQTLEQRVDERTRDLEAAADVARATTSMLDLGELLRQVVALVQERFGLYYVGLFLVDSERQFAVLRAGTGEAGQQMVAQEHKLRIGGDSMIGRCVAGGIAAIALDVGDEPHRFDNPLLPKTRSEMALPLRSRGQVVGAMTVQDTQEAAFDESDIAVMQTMADQVAVAIDNARLFAETDAALQDMEATHRRYLGQAWTEYVTSRARLGYAQTPAGLVSLGAETPESREANDQEQVDGPPPAVLVPIRQHDLPIGVFGVGEPKTGGRWTDEQIALVEAVTEQFALAADNIRLVEETQRHAARERLTRQIADNIRAATSIENAMQRAVEELARALDTDEMVARIGTEQDLLAERSASGNGGSVAPGGKA